MKKGAVFVDHTTASAEVARELDAAATKAGFKFIDAPVSGGQAGAENGVLTVMCGGKEDAYAAAEPIIAGSYARMCKLLGPAGAGFGRSVLRRGREDGRQALGYLEPDGPAGALS